MKNYFRASGRGVYLQSFVRVEKGEKYYFLCSYLHHICRARIFSLTEPERKVSDTSMASLKIETFRPNIQVLWRSQTSCKLRCVSLMVWIFLLHFSRKLLSFTPERFCLMKNHFLLICNVSS